jgi:hypothetical protein
MISDKSYVCLHVLAGDRPVLYACREDGDLVLACGGEDHRQSADDWKVAHLGHALDRDTTVAEVADLPEGTQAERAAVGEPWILSASTV